MKIKKWKCKVAWLLAGVCFISAAGCGNTAKVGKGESIGNTGQREAAKGRYIEVQKQTPDGLCAITDMTRLSDGSMAIVDADTGVLYVSSDNGDSWSKQELPAMAEKIADQADISSAAVAPDKGVFFSYVNWETSDTGMEEDAKTDEEKAGEDEPLVEEHYIYIDAAGTAKELSKDKEITDIIFYSAKAKFTGEKTVALIGVGGEVCQISLEEENVEQVQTGNSWEEQTESLFTEDYLILSQKIYQFSTKETIEDTVLSDFIREETSGYKRMGICTDPEEKTLYAAAVSGLYSHVIGGGTMEKLLDGGLSNLGDPSKTVAALLKGEDGSFFVAYEDGEIDQYTYDKEAPSVPEKQLTVYTLEKNPTVSKAISIFRKNHPDIYVKQEIGMAGEYGMTKEDAIKNLNTRLLADEGPDILILDGMPVDAYVERNILADLTETADGLEEKNAYFSNILRAYQRKDGLYAIPMRFEIPVLVGENEEIEGISNLTDLAARIQSIRKKHPDTKTLLGTYTAEDLLERLYMTSSPALRQEKQLDKAVVKEFLTQADAIYREEQKNITEEMKAQYEEAEVWNSEHGIIEENGYKIDVSCAFGIVGGEQVLAAGSLAGMEEFQMLNGICNTKEEFAYCLLPGLSEKVFSPKGIVGVNEKSKEKELAVSFVQELLGAEVQKSDLGDGFPVNADAYDTFTKNENPDQVVGFAASTVDEETGKETRVDFVAEWPKEREIQALKELAGTLTTPAVSDETITTAVIETGIKVLEGTLSIEEGCDEIVQKVELYLSE